MIPAPRFPPIAAFGLATALCACGLRRDDTEPLPPRPVRPGAFTTEGTRIVDAEGRERVFHGFNVSNDAKQRPYLGWAKPEDYARLRSWGVSIVRMLTSWAAVMPSRGVLDEGYLAAHDERVEWARRSGIAVMVDLHQDVFGEGFHDNGAPRWACDESLYAAYVPTEPWYLNYLSPLVQECYRRFWHDPELQDLYADYAVALAKRHHGKPHVVGFDLFNEPFWGSDNPTQAEFHRDQLQPFYERLIARIEAEAPGYLYFVEPATTSQLGFDPALEPFRRGAIVYAPHFYDVQTHDRHDYEGDGSGAARIFAAYAATADRLGAPWFLGEWGGNADSVRFLDFLRDVMRPLAARAVGWTYYEYSPSDGSFTPLRADHTEKPGVMDVLAPVYPKAIAGRVVAYAFDDRSRTFTLRWRTRASVTAPTLLALPPRHYPRGFVVESSDGPGRWSFEHDAAAAELRVAHDPGVAEHSLVVRPVP